MAEDYNLQQAIIELSKFLPEEVAERYSRTRFDSPANFIREIRSVAQDDSVDFSIREYAEFLDRGTRFIQADPFLSDVISDEDGDIEEIITNAFERDIDEAIERTISNGTGTIT